MGKTFRRDGKFRPKAHGRIFNKDFQPWKKPKKTNSPQHEKVKPEDDSLLPES